MIPFIKPVFHNYSFITSIILLSLCFASQAQRGQPIIKNPYSNRFFLDSLHKDPAYQSLRNHINKEFQHSSPGAWGPFIPGMTEDIKTKEKVIAFTFDACGGKGGNGYDIDLIRLLKKEKVPATLFITGLWIDAHYKTFTELAADTLFEIENHGLYHRPCAINGESKYGIHGTSSINEAIDEMEGNARKLEAITGRRPSFFRSATAYSDEAAIRIASCLGITMVSFDILSGDAVKGTATEEITKNVMSHIKPGAIIIMHMNHPERNTYEAMEQLIPLLRKKGYKFIKLEHHPMVSKN